MYCRFLASTLTALLLNVAVSDVVDAVEAPRDVPYEGTIQLDVDATDVTRGIFTVHQKIPVAVDQSTSSRSMVLLYPQWLPGNHSPSGRIEKLAGLAIRAGKTTLPWRRDPINVFAFHIEVPTGVDALDVDFQFVSPTAADQGRVVATPELLNLQWNAVVLYPAGYSANRIVVKPSVKLPNGWQFATALKALKPDGERQGFQPVTLDQLVDSPLFAGRYFKQIDLSPGATVPVRLNVFGDIAANVDITPAQVDIHRALVRQAYDVFGPGHFDRYDFLFCLSAGITGIGLEHLGSSENCTKPYYFTAWSDHVGDHELLAHEFTHSWNGKFRRPTGLATPGFEVPMQNELLWVYEGQTEYWGHVLATRSGMLSREQGLQGIARVAATYEQRRGRLWRSLADTTYDPIISARRPDPWRSWQRNEDYYSEGQLIWLDVDTLIRELSRGKRSLDDFARRFFGGHVGANAPVAYDLEEVIDTLNAVQPYDWRSLLDKRVNSVGDHAPLDGLTRGGYRLVFKDEQSDYDKKSETFNTNTHMIFSLGITINEAGLLTAVIWDSPAFNASLAVGTRLIAVNGRAFSRDVIRQAVQDAKTGPAVELLLQSGDRFRTVQVPYKDGLRYPHLERIPGTPDLLGKILEPRG